MKTTLLLITMIFEFLNCNNDNRLLSIIDELHNQNDSIRFEGLEKLENYKLTLEQQLFLLNIAKNKFPNAKYDWESISGKIVEIATKKPDIKLITIIKENFKDYDANAKNSSVSFLLNFNNNASIQTFTDLILKYPSDINFVSTGILEKNYSFKNILFPDLLKVIEYETLDFEILFLFLTYLNNNQLQAKDYNSYIDKLLVLSKKYRNIIEDRQSLNVDIWDNGDYQYARIKAGIIEDLFGYFNDNKVIAELLEYMKLNDIKLKMFATISLVKLGKSIDSKLIEEIAADSETRIWLYESLLSCNKENIFPSKYKTQEAFAESDMVNWLLFPTELGRKPDAIELMKVIQVDSKSDDGIVEFFLFRFKSNYKNWEDDGWMTGISGYFPIKNKPSINVFGYTFSSFEKWDNKTPDEHFQEILNIINDSNEQKK